VTTTAAPPAAQVTTGELAAEVAGYLALVQAQAAARAQVTQTVVGIVQGYLNVFDGWYDSDAITDLTKQILKQVQPAQTRVARLTDSYVARLVSKQRGKTERAAGAVDITRLRRQLPQDLIEKLARDEIDVPSITLGDTFDGPGDDIDAELADLLSLVDTPAEWKDPADAYGRIADQYRHDQIVNGATHEQALAKAQRRAEQVVDTDMSLVVREQEVRTARKLGVKTYRRVLHPELAESGLSCGLCIVAADRVYSVEKFKRELHAHCHCEMVPIDGDNDPGLKLNQADLDSLYRAAGRATGQDEPVTGGGKKQLGALKRVRVGITEHGELGPILVNQSGEFRTLKDFAKTQSVSPKIRAAAQIPALVKSLASLQARKADGENVPDSAISYHKQAIARLRKAAGDN
jgi:hypothetical protein